MPSHLVSLRAFLGSGILGPLTVDLSPIAVARLLGMPTGWIVNDGDAFPAVWTYGRHLEISFVAHEPQPPPHAMRFFQLEYAAGLDGTCAVLADNGGTTLVLALDGLSAATPVSGFVTAMAETGSVRVLASPGLYVDDWSVTVSNGKVDVVFASDPYNPSDVPAPAGMPDSAAARDVERCCRIDSIYVYRQTGTDSAAPTPAGSFLWPADRYLALIAGDTPVI